jgi:hypothetical protein
VDFVTIIVLYTVSTWLLWHWFRGTDHTATYAAMTTPIPIEAPTLLEHA